MCLPVFKTVLRQQCRGWVRFPYAPGVWLRGESVLVQAAEIVVCFEGASHAIMAEQMLLEQAFDVRVMPKPSSIQAGCGFCLRFLPEDFNKAAAFLSERGLPVTEAFLREEHDGVVSYRNMEEQMMKNAGKQFRLHRY